jgi:mono/diheme cytochrome c family protein
MEKMSKTTAALLAAVLCTAGAGTALAQSQEIDDAIATAVKEVNEKYAEHNLDIKKLFSQKCSWCHQGYGMRQADGPRLAGTEKSHEQLIKQIANGKSPMPGFKNQLKPHELQALADYIKALPRN